MGTIFYKLQQKIWNLLTLGHKELLSFFYMDERIFSDFDRARMIVRLMQKCYLFNLQDVMTSNWRSLVKANLSEKK